MANPSNVYQVDCDVTPVTEETYEYQTVTTTQDYYPNEMIGVNGSELADKFDDTQSLRFVGIHAGSARLRIKSDSNAQERLITVKKPRYITMYISSATAGTDEGKPVYAAYSNQVQFATGTYGNYVGRVKKVISSTLVQIDTLATEQTHDNTALTLAATGNDTLTRNHINRRIFVPNTAAKTLTLPAIAKLPIGAWMEFYKTTSDAYAFTLDGNASETINGATTYVSSTTQYDSVRIVNNGSEWQIDVAGEVTNFSRDVTLSSGANLVLSGTTGQSEINLTDNLADALSINISGGNDLMVFTTTDSAELVTIPNSFAAGSNATDRVTIKGIYMSPANVAVAVPSITDPDCARVQVDVSSAFAIQPAVGDFVIAAPQEALPTNARLNGAWVYQTDGIEINFQSEGGNVTGASKNFKFLVVDVT